MAHLSVVRAAIGARLGAIDKLVVTPNLAETTTLGDGGGAVVGGPTGGMTAMGRGDFQWEIPLYLLAPASNYDRATEILDELVNPFGDRSVWEAFWNDTSLGVLDSNGLVDVNAHIDGLTAYAVEFANAGVPHIGAVLNCVVHTPGKPT
jgi:hypothetical protein